MTYRQYLALLMLVPGLAVQAAPTTVKDLAGTYTLSAAYNLNPDGTRSESYGPKPRGMLYLGSDGKYALQVYHTVRAPFANAEYSKASADEYKQSVLTASTHFGRVSVDAEGQYVTFAIEAALNARWDKSEQKRPFTFKDGELSYHVIPQPNGTTPVSVWRRILH